MGKNVAVFVDVANIFYAAKAAGVDIDYVTLLKSASAGRDLVRAYAYTGLDPDNENQRNFHDFLRRSNYKVVSKDIRKYGDGKVKANLDIELVVDMMKTARNLDIAIIVSGDGDFAPAIRAVQEQGVRVEVISFRGNTSSDLIEAADQFTDIIQLARVEKGSRSGRRVADDDADLSMTEVPDKQTDGTGIGRGRGTRGGRGRGRGEGELVAASASRDRDRDRGRGRGRGTLAVARDGAGAPSGGTVVALPGERLSRAGGLTEADLAAAEVFTLDDLDAPTDGLAPIGVSDAPDGAERDENELLGEDGQPRRRRRRGGRGRGRGRAREDGLGTEASGLPVESTPDGQTFDVDEDDDVDVDDDEIAAEAAYKAAATAAPTAPVGPTAPAPARAPRTTPFGSVWDSQLATSPAPTNLGPIADDDEDFAEPEIPEYLIAEQRRGAAATRSGGPGRGPRGGRSAYQSAMDRERFGRGGGGGINRYPDVSARTGASANTGPSRGAPPRDERPVVRRDRDDRPRDDRPRESRPRDAAPRPTSSEPWSEVPPELEALLRAQVAAAPRPSSDARPERAPTTESADVADAVEAAPVAPRRRTTRTTKVVAEAVSEARAPEAADAPAAVAPAAPRRRTTRKVTSIEAAAVVAPVADGVAPTAPRRRTTRKAVTATADAPAAVAPAEEAAPAAPKRRTTRKAAAGALTGDADPT